MVSRSLVSPRFPVSCFLVISLITVFPRECVVDRIMLPKDPNTLNWNILQFYVDLIKLMTLRWGGYPGL